MQSITEVDQLEDDMTKSLTLDDNKTTIYKVDESTDKWIQLYSDEFVSFSYKTPYLYIDILKETPENDDLDKMFVYMNRFYDENPDIKFGKIYNLSNMGMCSMTDIHTFSKSLKKNSQKL